MKKKMIILGVCAALVLTIAVPIVTNLNTRVSEYPYSPELPVPFGAKRRKEKSSLQQMPEQE